MSFINSTYINLYQKIVKGHVFMLSFYNIVHKKLTICNKNTGQQSRKALRVPFFSSRFAVSENKVKPVKNEKQKK